MTPSPSEDHKQRLENLKTTPPSAPGVLSTATPGSPASPGLKAVAVPVPDARLLLEKAIDLVTVTNAALIQMQKQMLEQKTQFAALQASLPADCVEAQRQALQPLYGHHVSQREDMDGLKQVLRQVLSSLGDCRGSLKELFWVLAVTGAAVITAVGGSLWLGRQ